METFKIISLTVAIAGMIYYMIRTFKKQHRKLREIQQRRERLFKDKQHRK